MSDLFTHNIERYLGLHIMERHFIFKEMEAYAEDNDFPIVGPQVGQLLYILTRLSNANEVFEVGSGFGYSALWFGLGMSDTGTVVCTEYSEDNISRAREYLRKVDTLRSTLEFRQGNGIEILSQSTNLYDIIFNDANKEDYPVVFNLAKTRLKKNGLLISDNVLWHGQVAETDPDSKTAGVVEYNKLIFSSEEFFSSIIPIRDGVSVSMKL